MGRLEGRYAVVTGAGNGIGRAVAIRLAAEGARVAAMDIDMDGLNITADKIGAACIPVELDVTSEDSLKNASDVVNANFDELHILHANAGIANHSLASTCPHDVWDRTLAVNLTGAFRTIQTFLPLLRESEGY